MPQQVTSEVENNFTKGLITESTGLNFPENAATDTDNCTFTLIGDVLRREGIDYETNGIKQTLNRANKAISTYKWNNVAGDGVTQIVVKQVGNILYFYKSSIATVTSPLSTQLLSSTVDISASVPMGGSFDATVECQYADGNGYLFVYHPSCDPSYCIYNPATALISASTIPIKIRDFTGVLEVGLDVTARPNTLSTDHSYSLQNQGWTSGNNWFTTSQNTLIPTGGSQSLSVGTGLAISNGDIITMNAEDTLYNFPNGSIIQRQIATMSGTVTSYTSGSGVLVLNITSFSISSNTWNFTNYGGDGVTFYSTGIYYGLNHPWFISSVNKGVINTWHTAEGNYPSNADVWWYFKNSTGVFDPGTTQPNVTISSGRAPQGHYVLNAFNQDRNTAAGLAGITAITTTARPSTGTWFQGRVWYTGVNAAFATTGDAPNTTWTESIYFSQIIKDPSQFGSCYQTNDPTSETLFDLLPTDGGVVQIQGCGGIYKLFPLMNALLIFAANGVWYLTGNAGIGFTASDFTIVKLSSVRSISATSFVDVQGLPIFWNEEGIYKVQPAKQGTGLLSNPLHVNPLEVVPITLGTILTFYNSIPLSSKKYARGAYHPIDYIVQWTYRDTEAPDVTGRYTYNKILNYNDSNNAFFPYTVDSSVNSINGIIYVVGPGGSNSPPPLLKYVASSSTTMSFADEHDGTFVDWASATPINYVSHFVTGYKLRGQAIKRFQPQYIQVYSRTNGATSGYKIQGVWDFAISGNSGKYSQTQQVNILGPSNFGTIFKRHKIRGNGYVLQFFVTSTDGMPFDIQGWAVMDTVNQAA